jgi:hypothetical protein
MAPQFTDRFGRTARPKLLDKLGGNGCEHLRRKSKPINALEFRDAGKQALKARLAGVGFQIRKGDRFNGICLRVFRLPGILGIRLFTGQEPVDRGLASIAQARVDPLMVAGFEAVHGRADDPLEVVHRGRLNALRAAPVDRPVQTVAGLRIERQDLLVQPLTEHFEVVSSGRPKSKKAADRMPMPASLAPIEFVIGQQLDPGPQLHPQPARRVGIDLLMTLGKPAVQLHELQLNGKPQATSQPTFVGHTGQQGQFIGRQRPLVLKVDLDPGLRHDHACREGGRTDYRTITVSQMASNCSFAPTGPRRCAWR